MNDFMKRVQRLKKKLSISGPVMVTLVYMDGKERTMDDDAAFAEFFARDDIQDVRCANEGLLSLLVALLPGFDCASEWEDDSWMIEEGLI